MATVTKTGLPMGKARKIGSPSSLRECAVCVEDTGTKRPIVGVKMVAIILLKIEETTVVLNVGIVAVLATRREIAK